MLTKFLCVCCVLTPQLLAQPLTLSFGDTIRRMGHGDNWHMTWSDDGRQYVAWGDGRGFAPAALPTRNNGVAVLSGDADDFTVENLQGYPFIPESAQHWRSEERV